MRISIRLDIFDRIGPGAYTIVWLDTGERRWSREGYGHLRMPEWIVSSALTATR